ncbi:MAG: Fe-S cluster assembly protein SufD [Gammaproteobacteria bacterium]|nr:Fe-S cluster assembly protein SufD [Gammaproteobacteria bacterium]|tara:strand:+ start:1220 stop:2494 length:1275 start_codon:yes stop_codon:yes gene_type:complete
MSRSSLSMENLRKVVQDLPTDSLSPTRNAALINLSKSGLPTTKHEDWKYTDLKQPLDISNRWLAEGAFKTKNESLEFTIESIVASVDANWLIISNGKIDLQYFNKEKNIEVSRFSETTAPCIFDRPLSYFNAALMQDGLKVFINTSTKKPIGFLIIDNTDKSVSISQVNIEIEVACNCDSEIIEYHHSAGREDHYSNSVVTLNVNKNAITRYTKIQNRQTNHTQTSLAAITLKKDSKLKMACFDLGGGLIRNDVNINLIEPGSNADFNGLYLAGENQHIDNHTKVEHFVGPASSSQEYRGILNSDSCCVWNGRAIVHKGADGTDANQKNQNLLLSEKAEINTKPELEIYADEVKCSHGATVGQLDESAIFYLRTRGLSIQQATEIITQAFAADLVNKIPVSTVKEEVSLLVSSRLSKLISDKLV